MDKYMSINGNNNLTIISHLYPYHMDDKLSLFTLYHLLTKQDFNIIIKYLHPQLIDNSIITDKSIIKVDIGRIYDPQLNAFDHHHNPDLPCSFHLILKHFTDLNLDAKFIKAIDVIDRLGFYKASELGLIDNNIENAQIMREIILQTDINNITSEIVYNTIKYAIDKDLMHNIFVKTTFEELYKNAYNYLEDAFNKYLKQREFDEKAIKEIEVIEIANVIVGISKTNIRNKSLLKRLNIDLYIEPGSMQIENLLQTNLIVMDYAINKEDAYLLRDLICRREKINLTFKHNSGFLYVINNNIEDVKEIVYDIKKEIDSLIAM